MIITKLISLVIIKLCTTPYFVFGLSSYWFITTIMPSAIYSLLFCVPKFFYAKREAPLFIPDDDIEFIEYSDMIVISNEIKK